MVEATKMLLHALTKPSNSDGIRAKIGYGHKCQVYCFSAAGDIWLDSLGNPTDSNIKPKLKHNLKHIPPKRFKWF